MLRRSQTNKFLDFQAIVETYGRLYSCDIPGDSY